MKYIIGILVLAAICFAIWSNFSGKGSTVPTKPASTTQTVTDTGDTDDETEAGDSGTGMSIIEDEEDDQVFDDRKATELYKSDAEAFDTVQKAASNYDDIVLEQFSGIAKNCRWCPQFYKQVASSMLSKDLPADQRSYYAEILAISGDVNNIKTLVDAAKNADSQESANIYAESLELAQLDNEGLQYMKEQLHSQSDVLREAAIASITNQGTRDSIEALYGYTVEQSDPDGFYSLGIGLGEVIPEEAAYPTLQEMAAKQDQFSHLAIKALVNAGLPGLTRVFDILNNSKDPDFALHHLLKLDSDQTAIDHVTYDEETEKYVQDMAANSKNPAAVEFANRILEDFKQTMTDDVSDEELMLEDME